MEKTEDEFKMGGKSLLITAKVDGFRRFERVSHALERKSQFTVSSSM